MALTETPMQARTGADDLREVEAGPARRRPARRRSAGAAARGADPGRSPARRAAAPARDRRAGDRPPLQQALAPQLRPRQRLLPARLLHDEAQPAAQRAGGGAARPRPPAPGPGPQARPGRAGADVAAAGVAGRDLRPAPRQPAALRRLARRARRPAAHPRLPRRPRRRADQGAGARHLARHQPGLGDDGRLRGGQGRHQRARRGRDGRPAGEDRRGPRPGRLPDADQPQHARPLRREHRRDRRADPRGGGDALLRRRQPQRGDGPLAARRHGLRHRPRQPAQVLQPAARRRRPGRRPDRGLRADRALPAAAAGGAARERQRRRARASTSTSSGPSRSAACAASRATSASSSAPTPTSSASAATASPRPRRPRC